MGRLKGKRFATLCIVIVLVLICESLIFAKDKGAIEISGQQLLELKVENIESFKAKLMDLAKEYSDLGYNSSELLKVEDIDIETWNNDGVMLPKIINQEDNSERKFKDDLYDYCVQQKLTTSMDYSEIDLIAWTRNKIFVREEEVSNKGDIAYVDKDGERVKDPAKVTQEDLDNGIYFIEYRYSGQSIDPDLGRVNNPDYPDDYDNETNPNAWKIEPKDGSDLENYLRKKYGYGSPEFESMKARIIQAIWNDLPLRFPHMKKEEFTEDLVRDIYNYSIMQQAPSDVSIGRLKIVNKNGNYFTLNLSTLVFEPYEEEVPDQEITDASEGYVIDYDQLSAQFEYQINGGSGVTVSHSEPSDVEEWSPFNGIYELEFENLDSNKIIEHNPLDNTASMTSDEVTDTIYPSMDFVCHRAGFGDDPQNDGHSNARVLSGDFVLSGSGVDESGNNQERSYEYKTVVVIPGTTTVGEGTDTKTVEVVYSPQENANIEVTVLTYNGYSVDPTEDFSTSSTLNGDKTYDFQWEGNRIPFQVSRDMYEFDGSVVEVPGQFERDFQPFNTGSVTFEPTEGSFIPHAIEGTDKEKTITYTGMYMYAPYVDNTESSKEYSITGRNTLRAGYFYELRGSFKATITTGAYVYGTSTSSYNDTGHDQIVASVIEGFRVQSDIPTVDDAKSDAVYFPGYKTGNSLLSVDTEETKSASASHVSPFSAEYAKNMERQSAYKYREYVSTLINPPVYYVEETTEVIFTVRQTRDLFTYVRAEDKGFSVGAYVESFELSDGYIEDRSHSGGLSFGELPQGITTASNKRKYFNDKYIFEFVISGDMYDDVHSSGSD